MTANTDMRAIVVEKAGGPETFSYRSYPIPEAKPGWVLVRVRAFGLNRSEQMTRDGHSPNVEFPRVLGIEAVGEVVEDGTGELKPGQRVACVMGEMGRAFDGGYAEFTSVPASQVLPLETELAWEILGALPETFLTAWNSIVDVMRCGHGETLLVRAASSSVGMAAVTIAKDLGLTVIGTTRSEAKRQALLDHGCDEVIVAGDRLAETLRGLRPDGVQKVLDLVGPEVLRDSLQCAAKNGVVCVTGLLGGSWMMEQVSPMELIPHGVYLTKSSTHNVTRATHGAVMQAICDKVGDGSYRHGLHKVFRFDEIADAHRYMDANLTIGKLVVVTG